MNKVAMGIGALLLSLYGTAHAFCSDACSVFAPNHPRLLTLRIAGVFWESTSPFLNFSTNFPDVNNSRFEIFSNNDEESLNSHMEWGMQANASYLFACSSYDLSASYTHFNQDRDKHLDVPFFLEGPEQAGTTFVQAIPIPAINVAGRLAGNPLIGTTVPSTLIASFPEFLVTDALAKSTASNDTFDLDLGQRIHVGCHLFLRYFGGLRYSKIDQGLETFVSASGVTQTSQVIAGSFRSNGPPQIGFATINFQVNNDLHKETTENSRYSGFGPQLGLSANYQIGFGFDLIGSISTSMLIGETKSSLKQVFNVNTTVKPFNGAVNIPPNEAGTLARFIPSDIPSEPFNQVIDIHQPGVSRIVPNIDTKVGLVWSFNFCQCPTTLFSLEAGYLISHYFNAIDRLRDINLGTSDEDVDRNVDASFDGPYFAVQMTF